MFYDLAVSTAETASTTLQVETPKEAKAAAYGMAAGFAGSAGSALADVDYSLKTDMYTGSAAGVLAVGGSQVALDYTPEESAAMAAGVMAGALMGGATAEGFRQVKEKLTPD